MYISVLQRLLWPKNSLNIHESCVWWRIAVAFQCRKVWKDIRKSLGFWSFLAKRFLDLQKFVRIELTKLVPKTLVSCFGIEFSIPMSLAETFLTQGLLPFSGLLRVIKHLSVSTSVQRMLLASPALIAFSFIGLRNVEVFFPQPAIKASNSSSRGMKCSFLTVLHFGFSQYSPAVCRKAYRKTFLSTHIWRTVTVSCKKEAKNHFNMLWVGAIDKANQELMISTWKNWN